MILGSEIEAAQRFAGGTLQEIVWQHGQKSTPGQLHPFIYVLPFLQHVGGGTAEFIRNQCRDEIVDLERKTATSVYEANAEKDILDQGDIEALTRRARICGRNVAESQKSFTVHLRGVEESIHGFQAFQERYVDKTEGGRIQAERVHGVLRQELDFVKAHRRSWITFTGEWISRLTWYSPPRPLLSYLTGQSC